MAIKKPVNASKGRKAQKHTGVISLYNTLTRKKEIVKPIKKGKIGFYTCGPTVYDYAHIGNWRSFLFEDLLRRVLETKFSVHHVMNITDVGHLVSDADEGEDKMEKGAKREHKTAWEIAGFYTNAFKDDAKKMNIKEPTIMPKATDHIKEMIDLIAVLEKKKYTYRTDDGIYFDTSKLKNYGKLAMLDIKNLKAGARVEMGGKKRPTDFALWKFSPKDKRRDMEWDSPWGKGFPGWHIECSAMSIKYLGKTFDVHCGGIDHVPIHHTNEIAQSEAYTGKKFVNYWVHNEHMMIDSKKMSKSLGNFYTLSDIAARGFSPLAFRYFCLSAHYRTQINFTWDALKNASRTVDSLNNFVFRIKRFGLDIKSNTAIMSEIKKARKEFFSCLYNDLNAPEALSALFRFISFVNKELDEEKADKKSLENVCDFIMEIDKILAVISQEESEISDEDYKLIKEREHLRKEKKYAEADALRVLLGQHGVLVEDTSQGPV